MVNMELPYIQSIRDKTTPEKVGMKAYNLHRLSVAGFKQPLGYVIKEAAYRDFFKRNHFNGTFIDQRAFNKEKFDQSLEVRGIFSKGSLPPKLENELQELLKSHPGTRWAVRSSSTAEDLGEASFAGIYESYLNVKGFELLVDAIKKCWASMWTESVHHYMMQQKKLSKMKISMAIILQEMVPAQYAGVVFTRNPVFFNDEISVEYCEGIAEELVTGKVRPWSCSVGRQNLEIITDTSPAKKGLGKDKIIEIASLSLKLEKLFRKPLDIEWAYCNGTFFMLQARPITSKGKYFNKSKSHLWTRANIGEVLPCPVTPLTWHVFIATLTGRPEMLLENDKEISGNKIEGIRLIQGRAYIRLFDFWDTFCYLPFVTPEIMNRVLGVPVHPELGQYRKPSGAAVNFARILFILNLLRIVPRIETMMKRLPSLPDAYVSNLNDLIQWNTRCFQLHLKATIYNIAAFAAIHRFITHLLPHGGIDKLSSILTGNEDVQSSAQGIELWNIAKKIRSNKHVRSVFLKTRDWNQAKQILAKKPEGRVFIELFQRFLELNGSRTAGEFELSIPRWIEDPRFPYEMLQQYIRSSVAGSVSANIEKKQIKRNNAVDEITDQMGFISGRIFIRLLNSYSSFAAMRENIKYRLMEGSLALRRVFLDMGKSLYEEALLKRPDDIFYLTPREADDIFKDKRAIIDIKKIIHERKRGVKRFEKVKVSDLIDLTADNVDDNPDMDAVKGIGCSPGFIEGKACVLNDIGQSHILKPGEILVTHHTDPGWAPLFLVCGGLVTEIGGFLSHGATVAREYGIPAVVNATGALKKIKNGDTIRVDGTSGRVLLYNK